MTDVRVLRFDLQCRALKLFRSTARFLKRPARSHQYLFVLCPPYAGSTLMHEILCSSHRVSPTNIFGVREGLGLPEVRRLLQHEREWDAAFAHPWSSIRTEWLRYWDTSKPVLLDKSPPNLLRAAAIQACFRPASFIVMTRDPYAHCESLMRRNRLDAAAAAGLSLRCLRHQHENLERLDQTCLVRYEDLVAEPLATKRALEAFLPALGELTVSGRFTAHNQVHRALPLTDFNRPAFERLTGVQRERLTAVFSQSTDLMARFGYRLMT